MFSQKENLDLAFRTGESVGITATLVSLWNSRSSVSYFGYERDETYFGYNLENWLKAACNVDCVADGGGDA